MPEESWGDAGNDDIDNDVDGGKDGDIANLNAGSVVFIVRVWQPRVVGYVGVEVARQCRGVVEHIETHARHYFLTWSDMVGHLSGYVQCNEMAKPLTPQTGWRGTMQRIQISVSRWWRQI